MTRHLTTTPALDRAEQDWWTEYADLEERFCWVQTPFVQRLLRGAYLRRVVDLVRAGDEVLEVGCGTGWLSLLMARLAAGNVVGLDFSGDQVALARVAAATSHVADRVRFVEGGVGALSAERERGFDVVVLHAFLHHLSTHEISEALDETIGLLKDGGRLVVVEPVNDPLGPSEPPKSLKWLRWLERMPMALSRRDLRRVGPSEADARSRLDRRLRAEPPGGPSPKEHPFAPGELEAMLASRVRLDSAEPCLGIAHLVAQELLLARLSQPRMWAAALAPVLWVARVLDRRLLAADPKPSAIWVFHLFIGTRVPEPTG